MYLKKIYLENVGPIEKLVSKAGNSEIEGLELPFHKTGENAGNPKPLILVGQNGSGKSTILSFIVSALFSRKSKNFPDEKEIRKGSSFRVITKLQMKSEDAPYCGKVEFYNGDEINETKGVNEKCISYNETVNSSIIYSEGVFLFFPPNRFEEPLWSQNCIIYTESFLEPMTSWEESHRKIIQTSPLAEIKHWVLNTTFDKLLGQEKAKYTLDNVGKVVEEFLGFSGEVSFIFDYKGARRLGIKGAENSKEFIDLFAMSSGEVSLFCMFCAILRDADLAGLLDKKTDNSQWKNLGDIEGIVVIDEIDLHLHTKMQSEILPKLIALFPKIQFIITTHSPLFLLGMERLFGPNGIDIREMPSSKKLDYAKRFGEYSELKEFINEKSLNLHLKQKAEEIKKYEESLVVLVEGKTDERYLKKAIEIERKKEGKADYFKDVKIEKIGKIETDSENKEKEEYCGEKPLKEFFKLYKNNPAELDLGDKRVLLLLDCDVGATNEVSSDNKVYKKGIPFKKENLIKKGIENLFSNSVTDKKEVRKFFSRILLIKEQGGKQIKEREANVAEIADGSKKSLCDWICNKKNHSTDDFKNFDKIFEMIEEVLNSSNNTKS